MKTYRDLLDQALLWNSYDQLNSGAQEALLEEFSWPVEFQYVIDDLDLTYSEAADAVIHWANRLGQVDDFDFMDWEWLNLPVDQREVYDALS